MANDQATYDYTSDPKFLGAPPEVQHAYLNANNPNYAKADPEMQKAYISHVNGGTHGEREAALTPPIAGPSKGNPQKGISGVPYQGVGSTGKSYRAPVNPLGVAIGREEAEEPSNRAIGEATGLVGTYAPAMVSPVTTATSIAGGMAGAPIVSSGARNTVRVLGGSQRAQDIAGTVGGYAGGIGGAILGGGAGASFEGLPEETTIGGAKFRTPKFLRKSPFEPSEGYSNPLGPDKGEFEAQNEAQLTKEGKLAKIPPRMPKTPPTPEEIIARKQAIEDASNKAINRPGWTAPLPNRMPREKADFGEGAPGSSQRVTRVPEPNPVPPGENPNNQQSVPRRTTLVQNAKRAKEGAGTQLNQIHGPVLYEPRGAGYSGVREQVPLGGEPPAAGGAEGTVGKGPVGKTRSFEPIQSHTQPQFAGASDLPGYDKYVDALIAKGVDRNSAYQMADEDMTLANKPDYFNTIEREASLARIKRILGPEQRGPVRLGPEGRGIK